MKSFSLVLLISAIAVVSCNQCTYDYEPLLVWANDKQYNDAASLPFVFADYNAMRQGTGVSLADLEAKRQETVAWLQEGFGIPASQAFYDPNSHITAYPGLGNIIPIYFADAYELVSSSEPSFGLSRCYHLAAVEFVFIANADINFVYGGKFGQLIDLVGGSKQALGTDGVSVGWYYIQRDSGPHTRNVKRVAYKSVLPNRNDLPFRNPRASAAAERTIEAIYLDFNEVGSTRYVSSPLFCISSASWRAHQYMKMVDSEWGVGWSIMERSLYANYSNGKLISQILNSWKFNEQYDIYAAVGISV